ncbi:conserved hypothetical protein, partial [Trichinella spiralis]|uniref:hypothetical protein n=1 Tax=Trichinella spiralis TaxID=6334 RepID=UPI0001EFC1D3
MSGRGRLVNFHVPVEVEFEYERFGADEADVRSTAVVNHQMLGEVALLEESFSTLGADVASFARMPQFVFSQQLPGSEFLFTLETLVRRSSLVHTLMSDQFSFYTHYIVTGGQVDNIRQGIFHRLLWSVVGD